jgi:hypothetical protein
MATMGRHLRWVFLGVRRVICGAACVLGGGGGGVGGVMLRGTGGGECALKEVAYSGVVGLHTATWRWHLRWVGGVWGVGREMGGCCHVVG